MTTPGGPDEELKYRGTWEGEELEAGTRRAARDLDNMGDQADQASRRLARLQLQADRTGESLTLLAIKERAAGESFSSLDEKVSYIADEFKKATTKVEQHTVATKKNTQEVKKSENGFKSFKSMMTKTFGVLKSGLPIIKTLGTMWAYSAAIFEAASLVQPALQMVGALASLASYAALLPTLFGSFAAILLTTKLAISGVGDAISAAFSGDYMKLDAALVQLSPNAAQFVMTIMQFIPALKGLKGEVQDAFFGPLIGNMTQLLQTILPPLATDMTHLAGLIGAVVAHIASFMASAQGIKVLNTIFDNASHLVSAFDAGLGPLMKGFSDLIIAVGPIFNQMTGNITSLMTKFGDWLSQISQSGKLSDMLKSASKVAGDLWNILKSVFGIFSGLVTAAGQGQDPLKNIATAIGNIATWINSISGQNSLLGMFEQISQVANALHPVIDMIIQQLLPAVLPVIATLVTTLAPIATQLGQIISQYVAPALEQIITGLGPGLQSLIQALGQVFQALAPIWGPLATAISAIVEAIAPVLGVIAQEVAPVLAEVATEIAAIFKIVAPFIRLWADVMNMLFTMFAKPLMDLFTALQPLINQVLDAFTQALQPIEPLLADIAKQFASQVTPELMKLVPIIANELVPAFVNLANTIGKDLIRFIMQLMPQMPALTKAFIQLIEAGIQLFTILVPYIPMFVNLIAQFIQFGFQSGEMQGFLWALIKVVQIVATTLNGLIIVIEAVQKAHQDVSAGLQEVENVFTNVWNNIANIVKNVVGTVSNYIQQLKTDLSEAKSSLDSLTQGSALSLLLHGITGRWMGGPVDAGRPYVVGELGPEKFLSNTGAVKDIGKAGPELMNFTTPGLVIPNHMLNYFDTASAQMVKQARAIRSGQEMEAKLAGVAAQPRTRVEQRTEHHWSIPVNVTATSDIDFERSMKQVIEEAQQNAEERRQFG